MKTVLHVLGFKIVCHFDLFVGNGADQISPFVIAGLARKRRSCRFPETKPSSSEKYLNSKGEIDEEEEKAGKSCKSSCRRLLSTFRCSKVSLGVNFWDWIEIKMRKYFRNNNLCWVQLLDYKIETKSRYYIMLMLITGLQTSFSCRVVAQLVERSLSTPEVRGSNPVIGKKNYIEHCCLSTVLKRRK